MKKSGVLNHRLAEIIASMGHGDVLVVADAGLPVPPGVERIDLAVSAGLPGAIDVTNSIAGELQVERFALAEELVARNAPLAGAFIVLFPDAESTVVSHEELKHLSKQARAIVRTGECTAYANIVLI